MNLDLEKSLKLFESMIYPLLQGKYEISETFNVPKAIIENGTQQKEEKFFNAEELIERMCSILNIKKKDVLISHEKLIISPKELSTVFLIETEEGEIIKVNYKLKLNVW